MENFFQELKRAMSDVVEKIEDITVNKSGAGDAEEKKAVVERPPSPELNPEDDKDDEKESKGAAKGFALFEAYF